MTNLIDESALLLRVDNGDFDSAEDAGSRADASVEALIEQADGLDRQYSCHPINGTAIVRVESDRITIGDDNLQLMNGGWDALARYCGAPSGYWHQIDPEFRSRIAQYHIDDGQILEPISEVNGVEAIAFQSQFIGFRSARLVHLDFATIIRAVIEALGNDGQFYLVNRLNVTGDSISVELRTPRQTHAVQVGDVVQSGISLSHSFLGSHPTTVDLFIYRLRCQNGMSLRHCVGHSKISRSRRLKNKSEQSAAAAIEQIQRMVRERLSHRDALFASLSQLPEARIQQVAGSEDEESIRRFLLPSLRATHLWSDDLWRRVLAPAWRHVHGGNGELTEFAAVNTVTYVATHQRDLSFRQRRTLARLAGLLSFRRVHVCPRCNSAVIGS